MIFIIAAVCLVVGVAIGVVTGAVMREMGRTDAYNEGLQDGKRLMARWQYEGAKKEEL